MVILAQNITIHEILSGVSKTSGKPYFMLKCENSTGDNRYLSFFVTEEIYRSIEKGFIADKVYKVDFDYNVYNQKPSMRVIKCIR